MLLKLASMNPVRMTTTDQQVGARALADTLISRTRDPADFTRPVRNAAGNAQFG